jgi:hypothetical protein
MSSRVRLSLIACSREIMRIKQITVKHLFGIFDHTINLNMGSSGLCVETRSILIEYPQNSPKSLAR